MISANLSFLDDDEGNLRAVGIEVTVGQPDPDKARRIILVQAPPVGDPPPPEVPDGEGEKPVA